MPKARSGESQLPERIRNGEMGWLTGFEPATTGTTNRGSTPELQPPSICGKASSLISRGGKYNINFVFPVENSQVTRPLCLSINDINARENVKVNEAV